MSRSRSSLPALVVPVVFSLAACGRLFPPPPPDGKPIELPLARAAVTWTDKWGGTLELEADGTYTADRDCSASGRESGSGTWSLDGMHGVDEVDGNEITVEFATYFITYEALRNGRTLKLWTYIGEPDDGDLCVLPLPRGETAPAHTTPAPGKEFPGAGVARILRVLPGAADPRIRSPCHRPACRPERPRRPSPACRR
ncbi:MULTISPECIES: hypothetical protein [unclassified Streptomyces]|uniref:hypothetical protein n=1 Tax=unclassified Streptomyces TaxID=2593676 RepID=UPI000CD501F2|nr:hypothetical protein [Streptomyces sp. SM10]